MNIDFLKKEQEDSKRKLVELVEFINSEEYFALPFSEKNMVNQQRVGLEMYLNALTNRVYNKESIDYSSSMMMPLLLSSLFTGGSNTFGTSKEPMIPADILNSEIQGDLKNE